MTAETEAPKFQIVPFHQIVSLLEQNLATLCQLLPCKKYPREGSTTTPFCPHHTWLANFQPSFRGRASSNFCRFVRYRPFHRLDPFGRWSVVGSVGRCVFQRLPPTWFHLICHDYPLDRPRRRKALDLSWRVCVANCVVVQFRIIVDDPQPSHRPACHLAPCLVVDSACGPPSPEDVLEGASNWRHRTVQKMCEQCCIFFNSAAAQLWKDSLLAYLYQPTGVFGLYAT